MPTQVQGTGFLSPLTLLIVSCALIKVVLASTLSLSSQEAYYWAWSQYPDLSYFDHPPLASYSVWLTTALLGNTVFGIKMAAVIWSLAGNILLARLVIDMFNDRRLAFWTVLAVNLSLLYVSSSITSTPDAPLLCCWIGTIWAIWRVRQTGQSRWWYVAGCFMGLALLSKYVSILLLGGVGLYALFDPAMRRWFLNPHPYLALLISIAIFSPVIAWNVQHGWASMSFQSTRRIGEMNEIKPHYIGLLIVTQTLLLTPYLIWLAMRGLWINLRGLIKLHIPSHSLLLLLSAAVPLLVFSLASFRSEAKLHWLLPAWWSLVILGMHQALAVPANLRRLQIGLSTSASMLFVAAVVLVWPNLPPMGELNTEAVWRKAGVQVDALETKEREAGRQAFVFSPTYRISSLIWFHRPSQKRTHAQDIIGMRALQYDYFPQDCDLKGKSGIFVLPDKKEFRTGVSTIQPFFETVQLIEVVQTEPRGRRLEIWLGQNYRGKPESHNPLLEVCEK